MWNWLKKIYKNATTTEISLWDVSPMQLLQFGSDAYFKEFSRTPNAHR